MENQIRREKYPNSKLVNVSFEIRFFPLLEIDLNIVQFQAKIRESLPNYRIEKAFASTYDLGKVQEMTVHIFDSEVQELSLRITNSNFIFQTKKYETFEIFKKKIEEYTNKFFSQFKSIKEIIFIGLRYTNDFEFKGENFNLNKFIEYFNLGLDSAKIISNNINNFRLEQTYQIEDSKFKLFSGLQTDTKYNKIFFTIDLDSNMSNKKIDIDKLGNWLNIHHKNIKKEFESIITEKLRDEILRKSEVSNGE